MNYIPLLLAALALLLLLSACSPNKTTLETVPRVDLQRYLGLWYQIAYYPNSFQPKESVMTTAHYSLDKNGKIVVLNRAYLDEAHTKVKQARGKAYPVDETNTKLKVSFVFPFKGDYWIIDLDEKEYSYAVVSEPGMRYLWILGREPEMSKGTYNKIIESLKAKGFDLSRLDLTARISE